MVLYKGRLAMEMPLGNVLSQVEGKHRADPPLHLWHPKLSGNIDIRIDRAGRWFHEGTEIKRKSMVKLFASILRREDDGDYYLLTPAEKWRISVEFMPLMVVAAEFENTGSNTSQVIHIRTNTDKLLTIGQEHQLEMQKIEDGEYVPTIGIIHGLSALVTRSVYYQLAEVCVRGEGNSYGLYSGGCYFPLDF